MKSGDVDQEVRALIASIGSSVGGDRDQAEPFHETFLSLDPAAARVVSRDQLRAALPMRTRMFASIGALGTRLGDVTVIPLDDLHALARAAWDVEFADPDAEPLQLRSTFLLRRVEGQWVVVVYLNHQDIVQIAAARSSRSPAT